MALIEFSSSGLFCPQGNFYIDPWKPVDYAVITHAHSDHAKFGNRNYLSQEETKPLLKLRLGEDIKIETLKWQETININGVKLTFHPAGHIIGSAQVRLEYKNEVWVFTGDFKTENDGLSKPFEPLKCNTLITESTFALPIYKWQSQSVIFDKMKTWVNENHSSGFASIILAYSLGKAQRILKPLQETDIKIFAHGAVYNVHETLINSGWDLPKINRINLDTKKEELKGSIILAPPSADGSTWMKKFHPYKKGICSGWMQVRGNVRRKNADAGFILSDHADWQGLISSIKYSGAEKVFVTHGFQSVLSRYLNENNISAAEVKTLFSDDEEGKAES